MTLASLIVSDVGDVVLNTDDFAETIKRRVEDGRGNRVSDVIAIVTWDPALPNATEGKREAVIKATLLIASGLVPAPKMSDRWEIGGVTYSTTAILPAQYGMQNVMIEQRSGDMRGGSLGVL